MTQSEPQTQSVLPSKLVESVLIHLDAIKKDEDAFEDALSLRGAEDDLRSGDAQSIDAAVKALSGITDRLFSEAGKAVTSSEAARREAYAASDAAATAMTLFHYAHRYQDPNYSKGPEEAE